MMTTFVIDNNQLRLSDMLIIAILENYHASLRK